MSPTISVVMPPSRSPFSSMMTLLTMAEAMIPRPETMMSQGPTLGTSRPEIVPRMVMGRTTFLVPLSAPR